MRVLAFVAVAVLVGCSKPYEGTSFKARPKPPTEFEIAERRLGEGQIVYGADQDDVFPGTPASLTKAIGQTPLVFPVTAQPTGQPPVSGR